MADIKNAECKKGKGKEVQEQIVNENTKEYEPISSRRSRKLKLRQERREQRAQQNPKEATFSQSRVNPRANNCEKKINVKQGKEQQNVADDGIEKNPSRKLGKQKCQQQRRNNVGNNIHSKIRKKYRLRKRLRKEKRHRNLVIIL